MGLLSYFRDWKVYLSHKARGFYEGGKITNANRDFWNTNATFEDYATPDRDRLRARARWLSANNAIMDNIDTAVMNNVIGTGIELQSITGKAKFDSDVERLWKQWTKSRKLCDATGRFTFGDLQRLILKARMVDGEIFIYKLITEDGLKLQLIEADSLDYTRNDGGVETDNLGTVIAYHFLDKNSKSYRIDAKYIINYFQAERPTQMRGVSEYKQAILDLKNFSAFQTASIQGARARANIAYAVKNNVTNGDPYGANFDDKIQTINGVSVLYLKQGESIDKLDPDSVATDYVQFSENTIRLIATARKVSYELAFRDYSKVNFASSRASLLQDFKRFDFEQTHLVDYVLSDIYETWLEVEIMRGKIKANGFEKNREKWIMPKWIMPKRDLVDPLKEITALEKKIAMNITCETDVANSNGEDYEQILAKKSKEIELKKKYGIPDLTTENLANDDGTLDYDENMTGAESSNDKGAK
jgi:lambda family phage portal protein